MAAAEASGTASAHVFVAVMLLFFVDELGLEPLLIGLVFGIGGLSALPGALLAGRAVRRWGTGPTLIGSFFVNAAPNLSTALAAGPRPLVVAMVALPQLTDGAGTVYQITRTSLIQASTPGRLLGRVMASMQVMEQAGRLLGLLLGGVLGELIGLRLTFLVGALGTVLAGLWLVCSPLPGLKAPPAPGAEPEATTTGA